MMGKPPGPLPKATIHPRLRLPVALVFLLMTLFAALRVSLALLFPPTSPTPASDWIKVCLVGLHLDLAASMVLTAPLAVWSAIAPSKTWRSSWHRATLALLLVLAWSGLVFLLIAEGYFFEEFRSRYNPVAIDYLIYPHEVFVNVWQSYPLIRVVLICATAGTIFAGLSTRILRSTCESAPNWRSGRWSTGATQ